MKLFFYYAFCSVKNQLKKLFKTWVLIFLVACLAVGFLIGAGAAFLSDLAGAPDEEIEETLPEEEIPEEEIIFETSVENPGIEVAELIVGALVFLLFFFGVFSADKSGNAIFQPADVNLLFPSPMKPQSVLLFRLLTQIGVILFSSIYLIFQIPNLILAFDLSIWSVLGILATWLLAVAVSKLLQILLYTVASTHLGMKKYLRMSLYVLVLIIAGAFYLYSRSYNGDYFAAAVGFFNHDLTRWIPLWGWIKGLAMYAVEGNILGSLLCLGASLISGAVLAMIVWNIKADFYEDAMAKSQETAELQEAAQAEGGVIIKRKKDRSEKLKRDGMNRGFGANIFFFRVMYNRFRFAHFGFLTKTSETYLVAAVGVALLCRFIIEVNGLVPVIFVLAALAFFRTLGNPLEEDTSKDFFRLIPESTISKLFWSVLAGTATCLMDLIPGLVLATIILGVNPMFVLAWIPFILSIDFYGTNVGVFINLSVPVSAGKPLKQIVQIMFIYFGLLPDIIIMAVGMIFGYTALAAIIAAVFNCALGAIFLAFTPFFIDYPEKRAIKKV